MRTGRGSYGSTKDEVQMRLHRHRSTSRATLYSVDDDVKAAVWLPDSQLYVTESEIPGVDIVTMPEWLAKKNELI